jgi:transposase
MKPTFGLRASGCDVICFRVYLEQLALALKLTKPALQLLVVHALKRTKQLLASHWLVLLNPRQQLGLSALFHSFLAFACVTSRGHSAALEKPTKRQIHVIADNLSAHKAKKVFEFLAENPTVRIHYTPTYSSWRNQVEIWFSKIQRDVISRGVFTSVNDLARKLMRYIRNYNKTATPVRWIYKNVRHRIIPDAI